MIELIFSLVIIGITLASAPLLISTSSKSSYLALQQESIAAAVTQMNIIMTSQWDHADTNTTIGEPTLTTDSTIFNQCPSASSLPSGTTSDTGRYCQPLGGPTITYAASNTLGTDSSPGESLAYDDVDDYHNKSYTVSVYSGDSYDTSSGDYIDKDINVTASVYYGDDTPRTTEDVAGTYGETTTFSNPFRHINPAVGTTNVKLFSVKLSSTNSAEELSSKDIRLSAFMANIGAPKKFITNELSL
jgi:type II secretory pathway pseudopilin PulG